MIGDKLLIICHGFVLVDTRISRIHGKSKMQRTFSHVSVLFSLTFVQHNKVKEAMYEAFSCTVVLQATGSAYLSLTDLELVLSCEKRKRPFVKETETKTKK